MPFFSNAEGVCVSEIGLILPIVSVGYGLSRVEGVCVVILGRDSAIRERWGWFLRARRGSWGNFGPIEAI